MNQIGRSLRGISLLREVSRHASELEARVEERTRQLKETEQQLLETAHQAGMAEVAVGMMHNVGNLLNSIGISAEELLSGTAKPNGLARANALLTAHQADLPGFFASDPSAKFLPAYYAKTTEAAEGARIKLHEEARTLLDRVELVKESIRMLQEYARVGKESTLREEVQVAQVIEAALKLQASSLSRNRIELSQEIEAVPPIVAQRAKLVHTFVNLIKNAIEAMRTTPLGERRLTIELRPGAAGQLVIRIADTGEGIAPENRHRIFTYGFTTKESGNGFGLHTCAKYVKQMGGSIVVESQGPGLGASFVIVLQPMPADGARAAD
jgi:signal transduction histidine kinase